MCIWNNDNCVNVIYFIMDGGILGYFLKIFKKKYVFFWLGLEYINIYF